MKSMVSVRARARQSHVPSPRPSPSSPLARRRWTGVQCAPMSAATKKQTGNLRRGGPGRPKGVPNKVTTDAREGIRLLVEANIPKMSGWLTQIEKEHGPLHAARVVQDLIEYAVPKLQRTELTGEAGGPVQVTINKLA